MNWRSYFFRSYFETPNIPLERAFEHTVGLFKRLGLRSEVFTTRPGFGRRRKMRSDGKLYSTGEILEELRRDAFDDVGPGFDISVPSECGQYNVSVSPPYPRSPYQSLAISFTGCFNSDAFHPFVQQLAAEYGFIFAGLHESEYLGWQRCKDPEWYSKKYGLTDGFELVRIAGSGSRPEQILLDTSKNPGRTSFMHDVPVSVSADMWLGCAFWTHAPCNKEEVIGQPWEETRELQRCLYLKAYSEPFEKPDGEQGRIQRRLWNLLFHQDCEWPHGSGGVA